MLYLYNWINIASKTRTGGYPRTLAASIIKSTDMKKIIILILFFIFPILLIGQVNDYIKFNKSFVKSLSKKIHNVEIICNDSLYNQKVLEYNQAIKNQQEQIPTGYGELVHLDFFKEATKFKVSNGICYALNFTLDKGKFFEFTVDTFLIPKGSFLILSDSLGNEINKYSYDAKTRHNYDGKMVVNMGQDYRLALFRPIKQILVTIIFSKKLNIDNYKITFNEIDIHMWRY